MNNPTLPADLKAAASGAAAQARALIGGLAAIFGRGLLWLLGYGREARELHAYIEDTLSQFAALMERIAAEGVIEPQSRARPQSAPRPSRASRESYARAPRRRPAPISPLARAPRSASPIPPPTPSITSRARALIVLRERRPKKTELERRHNSVFVVTIKQ